MHKSLPWIIGLILALALLAASAALLVHKLSPSNWAHLEQRVEKTIGEQIVRISASQGDKLELASIETMETFRETDSLDLGWVNLGTSTAEIRVPVVYRFHVALAEGLRVNVTRHGDLARCVVHAPTLRATLPPAIRTEGLEKHADNGWARFNSGEQLAALEKGLTTDLILRAPRKAELAKDKARVALAGFVKRWLVGENLWGADAGIREIVVVFPGEPEADASPAVLP